MATTEALGHRARGRAAFDRRSWAAAYAELSAVDDESTIDLDDLERLAMSAYLVGKDDESVATLERAYRELMDSGQPVRAARSAFWLAFILIHHDEPARGGGWLARAQRVLDDGGHDCAERGYLQVLSALQRSMNGEAAAAHQMFSDVLRIGEQHGDLDLMTFGRLGQGQTLVQLGRVAEGLTTLDEAMVAVTADEVSPIVAGLVYCAVIGLCQSTFDLRRAREWTAALSHWCESQPDLVPYRGQCLVHRVEIMQVNGAWLDAQLEADRACQRLSDPPGQPAIGGALYQQAELHRLRGEVEAAETAYRRASAFGEEPQPTCWVLFSK